MQFTIAGYLVVRSQEASTGLFLTVTGDEVVLQETELRNVCRFDAWQRQARGFASFGRSETRSLLDQLMLAKVSCTIVASSRGAPVSWGGKTPFFDHLTFLRTGGRERSEIQ